MFRKHTRLRWASLPVLAIALAGNVAGTGGLHAESIVPALHTTMRTMRASLAEIGDFIDGKGEPATALDAATKVIVLAKSIPSLFPPGSELEELPGKSGAAPTSWDDVDRFLEAQKHLVIESAKLRAAVKDGNREAIVRQLATTRSACSACHDRFRD
jgi:cytochrome c556